MNIKQNILAQCRAQNVQVTPLREHVLDIVLQLDGVIKAYTVLAQMQRKRQRTRPAHRLPRPRLLGRARRAAQNPRRKRLHPMQPRATRMQQPLPQRCPQPQQQLHPCVHPMRHGGRAKPQPRMASPAPSRRTNRLRAERRTRCAHRRMRQMPRMKRCGVLNPFSGCLWRGNANARGSLKNKTVWC